MFSLLNSEEAYYNLCEIYYHVSERHVMQYVNILLKYVIYLRNFWFKCVEEWGGEDEIKG